MRVSEAIQCKYLYYFFYTHGVWDISIYIYFSLLIASGAFLGFFLRKRMTWH